jgi:small subunit ribosomal protein S1
MNQSELGQTEEEMGVPSSSAGLSESETVHTADQPESSATAPAPVAADEVEQPSADAAADTATDTAAPSDDADSAGDADHTADVAGAGDAEGTADEEYNGIRRGMLVNGTIARTTPTALYVTLENGAEGIVPGSELEVMGKKLLDELKPGAPVMVYVVNPRNLKGKTILSINHALEEGDWQQAEEYRQNRQVYDGKIGGYNKGGLIVRFGRLRGFVPQSQIAEDRLRDMSGETPEERYGRMVGQTIGVKVMEVDRSRNRLILSERAAMREVRQRRKETLIHELKVDEVREGVVVSLENFGAFVDIGGAEGLIHLTEITWRHITHPRQALAKGQTVRVKVISIDPDANRIGLSMKQLLPDPWDEIALEYGNGALVKGTITKLTKFGAFARIDTAEEPIEGLIHISELSDERVEHPREVVNKGDVLTLRVVKVDVKNRRLGLSLKKVISAEFLDQDMERAYRDAERGIAIPTVRPVDFSLEDDDDDDLPPGIVAEVAEAAPAPASVDSLAEAPAPVSVDSLAEAPAPVSVDSLAEAPAPVSVDSPAEAPAAAVTDSPAETAEQPAAADTDSAAATDNEA